LRELVWVGSRLAFGGLGDVIGELGQGLRGANADATRNANPLQDASPDLVTSLYQVTFDATEVNEGLINAVDLLGRAKTCCQAHHPVGHVAIQREVGRQSTRPESSARCLIWNQGAPMAIPSALASLLRAMAHPSLLDRTTTGRPFRLGLKTRSHENIEVVAVYKGVHGVIPTERQADGNCLMQPGDHTPDFDGLAFLGHDVGIGGIGCLKLERRPARW